MKLKLLWLISVPLDDCWLNFLGKRIHNWIENKCFPFPLGTGCDLKYRKPSNSKENSTHSGQDWTVNNEIIKITLKVPNLEHWT